MFRLLLRLRADKLQKLGMLQMEEGLDDAFFYRHSSLSLATLALALLHYPHSKVRCLWKSFAESLMCELSTLRTFTHTRRVHAGPSQDHKP